MTALRRSVLVRWLVALLLLAALAWGLGQLRSERGAKPELGVGDLRPAEAVEQTDRMSEAKDASAVAPAPEATDAAPDPGAEAEATGER